jgi:hypothetical protein
LVSLVVVPSEEEEEAAAVTGGGGGGVVGLGDGVSLLLPGGVRMTGRDARVATSGWGREAGTCGIYVCDERFMCVNI